MGSLRLSLCLNTGPRKGQSQATVVVQPEADALVQAAANKLRVKRRTCRACACLCGARASSYRAMSRSPAGCAMATWSRFRWASPTRGLSVPALPALRKQELREARRSG